MRSVMLTTEDNPYNPKTQFDEWYNYDIQHGYNTCSYLARIARTSPDLGDELNDKEVESAIDEIVELNVNGKYKKLVFND